jgi:tetratricopeptide (TPR) repeat protein
MTDDGDEASEAPRGAFRANLRRAHAALERDDVVTEERLYGVVLGQDPGNSDAVAGLAEVAKRRRNPEKAAKMYDQVLEKNPNYLPALVGRADQKWAAGDRRGALVMYRKILEQAGADTSYGQHAARRIDQARREKEEGDSVPEEKPEPTPTEQPSASEPSASEPAKPEQPHIDTTDLPEFNQ